MDNICWIILRKQFPFKNKKAAALMSYVRSFFKNPHLDFSKINAHFTRKHYCRVCLGRKNRIEHLSGRSILPPLSRETPWSRKALRGFFLHFHEQFPLFFPYRMETPFMNASIRFALSGLGVSVPRPFYYSAYGNKKRVNGSEWHYTDKIVSCDNSPANEVKPKPRWRE